MTALVLSDIHLRDATSAKALLVTRFLEQTASQFERIYILGDLFDAWPVTSGYLVQTFRPVLQALHRLVENGQRVSYVEGNHDFHLGRYFSERLGIQVFPNELIDEWNGKRVFMTHGDLGNPKDFAYRLFRRLTHKKLFGLGLKCLPAPLVYHIGRTASLVSRKYRRLSPSEELRIRQTYRQTACSLFKKGYDVVIMGHTHLPDDFEYSIDGRVCRYVNTGDWIKHFTYLEFDGKEIYTKSHPLKHT